jgi:quinol monooxygenase YgiN
MITRIVKLTFQEERIADFISFFDTINTRVSTFENCHGMRLMQEKGREHVVFTYSLWESEDALNKYRDSELFQGVWSTIKPWFAERAEAWTVETYFEDGNFSANQSE